MDLKAKFIYSNSVDEEIKPLLESAFVLIRNEACELLNPHFEDWNEEYGKVDDVDDYNSFIDNKCNNVLEVLNKRPIYFVKLKSEGGDLIGIFNETKIYLRLIPC